MGIKMKLRPRPFDPGKSLAALHPEVAAQWHPTRNGDFTADKVGAYSYSKIWFKCPEGPDHEWEAWPADRVNKGHGCPFCSGRRVSITTFLARKYPDLAAQWHPVKNSKWISAPLSK